MSRIVCTILFLSIYNNAISQVEKDSFYPGNSLSFRTNPFSVLDYEAGIMLGINYRWDKRWSATIDPTFIFFTIEAPLNGLPSGRPLGVKIKTDVRYHIQNFIWGFKNIFIAPEAIFRYVRTKRTAVFGINCTGPNCAYYMRSDYTEIKKEKGGAIKIGLIGPIKKGNENWKLELFFGLGLSFFDFQEKEIPTGGSFVNLPEYRDNLGFVREDKPTLMIPLGLKISYRIN